MNLNGYSPAEMQKCAVAPCETIMNKLSELKGLIIENDKLAYEINEKLYNPEPCNPCCGGNGAPPTIESVIDEIRRIAIETNRTLVNTNSRL